MAPNNIATGSVQFFKNFSIVISFKFRVQSKVKTQNLTLNGEFSTKFCYICTLFLYGTTQTTHIIYTDLPLATRFSTKRRQYLAKDFVVVIDAGHGGHDPGAIGKISKEKNINLKVALKLGNQIKQNCNDVKQYIPAAKMFYTTGSPCRNCQ